MGLLQHVLVLLMALVPIVHGNMDNCTDQTSSKALPPLDNAAGECPPCMRKMPGGCSCDNDWSTSSLECVTNPQASKLEGYSSRPIYNDRGEIAIKGTYIFTDSFRSGWACSDGYGGYYTGAFCHEAHGAICKCEDGFVWTNASCQPMICDPNTTPHRCVCTFDDSC